MRRRILKAQVKRVALCRRGMNALQTLYKGQGGALVQAMTKAAPSFEERGELLSVVASPPNREDLEGDAFDSMEAVQSAAHSFMLEGAELDLEHDGKALSKSDAYVAESFVIQEGDPRFVGWEDYSGQKVDVTGGWGMLIKIGSPELRKSYRDGDWDGVSLFAPEALMQPIEKSSRVGDEVREALREAGLITEGVEDMTPQELEAALAKSNDGLAVALTKSLGEVLKAALTKEDTSGEANSEDKIEFVGDPTNKADLEKHLLRVKTAELKKSGDLNDPAKLAEMLKSLGEEEPKETEEVTMLKAKLAKAQGKSNQGAGENESDNDEGAEFNDHQLVKGGLVKADVLAKSIADSKAIAAVLNKQRFGTSD